MSEQLYTMANTRVYISTTPVAAKLEVTPADFAGLSFVLIDGLYNLGPLGADQAINEFELINSDWMFKTKGTKNGGTMTNTFIPLALDAGQIKADEAIEEKCRPYAIKIERGADCSPSSAVTITTADPAVVTWANHGLLAGQPVVFTSTGSLPTGLTAGTTYYVLAADLTTNAFTVSATPGGAAVETTAAGSGINTATAAPAGMTDLFQALVTDGERSGGGKNDVYTRTISFAVNGRVVRI